jgi:hypothetical protein
LVAQFDKTVDFTAILSERCFTLEKTGFQHVPNFIQAHFAEAPVSTMSTSARTLGLWIAILPRATGP